MRRFSVIAFATVLAVLHSGIGSAQTLQTPALNLTGTPAVSSEADTADEGVGGAGQFRPRPVSNALPGFGIGVKAGTLGIGIQVGTALAQRINLRGGVNFFKYSDSLSKDGALYAGTLNLKSVEAKLDLFVIGGFRVTPGLLLYNGNNISATASVASNQTFTLNGVSYSSSASNPITGNAALTLNKFAPTLGIGFGNLLPRSARHFSLSTDLGVVFQGSPQFALSLAGTGCVNGTTNCQTINNLPGAAANIEAERVKIQNDASPFKYYPEVSLMLGYKF